MTLSLSTSPIGWLHYLPILTTLVAIPFALALVRRYRERGGAHHGWWALGVACYGAGTALESVITLFGNTVFLNKAWYIAGALLGAYPLAQGTVHLILAPRTARLWTRITLPFAVLLAVLVVASPVDASALESHRPGGAILSWTWVRALTPLLNLYAAGFLVGGAAWSALRYRKTGLEPARAIGNTFIAAGALLPAIGGGMAKAGTVEALYVAELVGLLLIWVGFAWCTRPPSD